MRTLLAVVLAAGCGGPAQNELLESPSAMQPRAPSLAPPASTSDRDRERGVQQFEDMETTQRAYREAGQQQARPAAGSVLAPATGRKAPVEQAPAGSGSGAGSGSSTPPGATPGSAPGSAAPPR